MGECWFLMLRANNFLLPPYTRTSITHARGLSLGFGASLVFGTLAGGMADMIGRKKICILFSLAYTGSCITKLWNNYHILMVGRKCSVEISLSNRESAREQWWGRSTPPLFFRVVSADMDWSVCVCGGRGGRGHCIALHFGAPSYACTWRGTPHRVSLCCTCGTRICTQAGTVA